MTNKQKHLLSLGFVLVLVAVAIYLIYPVQRTTKLGLDLKGGMSVILTAQPSKGTPVTEQTMDQAELVIRNRVDRLGVAEPEIQRQGASSILVQLPGIKDPDRALEIIGKTALLEFKVLEEGSEGGKAKLGPQLMTGDALSNANATFGEMNKPIVELSFNRAGAKKFADITTKHVKQRLAIILDKKIISAPTIQEPITGGQAVITGIETLDEAKEIALVLQTGRLPVELDISEQRTVGPTLGQDSLVAGLRAGIIGLVLVVIFMLFYYRGLGLITSVALAVFASVFWGVIAVLGRFHLWNLTLPGMAGIILSIGVAADSNIILFERVKEEVALGKTFRTAADSGFLHAFKTILDADLVTFVTAAILFWIGVGPVRGFALTLMLGIAIDMFTFIFFTRSAITLVAQVWPKGAPRLLGIKEVT